MGKNFISIFEELHEQFIHHITFLKCCECDQINGSPSETLGGPWSLPNEHYGLDNKWIECECKPSSHLSRLHLLILWMMWCLHGWKLWQVLISLLVLNELSLMFYKYTNEGHSYNSFETIELCVKSWDQTPIELAKMRVWECTHIVPQVILWLQLTCLKSGVGILKKKI